MLGAAAPASTHRGRRCARPASPGTCRRRRARSTPPPPRRASAAGHEVLAAVLRSTSPYGRAGAPERERRLLAAHVDLLAERAAASGTITCTFATGKPEDVRRSGPGHPWAPWLEIQIDMLPWPGSQLATVPGSPSAPRCSAAGGSCRSPRGRPSRTPPRARGRRATWWSGPRSTRALRAPTRCRRRPRARGRSPWAAARTRR